MDAHGPSGAARTSSAEGDFCGSTSSSGDCPAPGSAHGHQSRQLGSALRRVRALRRHATLGEAAHSSADAPKLSADEARLAKATMRFRYERRPHKIVHREAGAGGGGGGDIYGGVEGVIVLEAEQLVPSSTSTDVPSTVVVFMHPCAIMHTLPLPIALARSGMHVVTAVSRYPNNDSALLMEKAARDLGAVVAFCKSKLGYSRVVLGGWSGGGSLACFYQAQAECRPERRVRSDIPGADLQSARMPAADALMVLAAHSSRARILCEWLDPSIYLLRRGDGGKKERALREFDLYGPHAPKPPYTEAYLRRFRAAQLARNRRITAWVKAQLRDAAREPARRRGSSSSSGGGGSSSSSSSSSSSGGSACFVVEGTMADPRWLDLSLDPNDRPTAGKCFLGDPAVANMSPTGLARYCTFHSWLSQWSVDDSNADGVRHIATVRVPVLVVENSADDAVPASHPRSMFEACTADDKEYRVVHGANHYYDGQKGKVVEACLAVLDWLSRHSLVDVARPPAESAPGPTPTPSGSGRAAADDESAALVELRRRYDGASATGFGIKGINHLALVSSDMARTCAFYGGVLGLRLSKTIALPGGGQHFFFDAGMPDSSLAFFYFRDAPPAKPGVAAPDILESLAKSGKHPSAAGSMNHVAFNVSPDDIEACRRRLEESPLCPWVSPLVFHADTPSGWAKSRDDPRVAWISCYFSGPDGELLEVAAQTREFTDQARDVRHLPKAALHKDWRR